MGLMEGPAYLLMTPDGATLGVAETVDEALEMAYEIDPSGQIYLDAPTEVDFEEIAAGQQLDLVANAKRSLKTIENAPADSLRATMKAIGETKIDFRAAMRLSLDKAHRALRDFFPTRRPDGKRVKVYQTPKGMARHLLGQNYKTAKETPKHIIDTLYWDTGFRSADVMGLSLLPTTQSFRNDAVARIMRRAKPDFGVKKVASIRLNACVRATPECASSCLVFSGHNQSDDYNTVKKYALVSALIQEPEAFIRMLVEAIRYHRSRSFRSATMPLIRLNVFSDLPWELMVPEMFQLLGDVQFYDYTKVPNRLPPPNYDITFSFAGTEGNVAGMDFEIQERGRRVAVVFAASKMRRLYKSQWMDPDGTPRERLSAEDTARRLRQAGADVTPLGEVEVPVKPGFFRRKPGKKRPVMHAARLPDKFLGLPVVDGDVSDLRPYDPAPSIVGLTWKEPKSQNVTLEQARVFVVLVDLVPRGGGYYDAIVSKTARFDGIDYSKHAPSITDE